MGRINGKNTMRTPEEKEKWVLKYFNEEIGFRSGARIIGVNISVFRDWINKYKAFGIEGLKSKTGKCSKKGITGRPKKAVTREEELERENANLKIEIKRLKKVIM